MTLPEVLLEFVEQPRPPRSVTPALAVTPTRCSRLPLTGCRLGSARG